MKKAMYTANVSCHHPFMAYRRFFPALFALGLMVAPFPAGAQTTGELRLATSPLPINLVTEPGQAISTELRIKNGGTEEERLKIDVLKFRAYEDSGQPQLMDPEPADDFIHWVSFSETTFVVAPEEWKTVTATFRVPPEASFSYYYAFVFSRAGEAQATGERQTAVVGGTATLVLLEARVPEAKRSVEVVEFSANKKVYEFLPAVLTVKLRNTGNVHIAPRGNIFIDQGSKKDIAILEVNEPRGNILPDSQRSFSTAWQDGFPRYELEHKDGKTVLNDQGEAVLKLTWDWKESSKLRFGKYTGKLLLVYDDGTRDVPIEGTLTFWVMPWRIIVGAIIVLFFVLIGFQSTIRNLWWKIKGVKKP